MHYCFPTVGTLDGAASFVRQREFGNELIKRGFTVSYVVDDFPINHNDYKIHPQAKIAYTPFPSSLKQLAARREVIRDLKPDLIHVLNPLPKSHLALAGASWAKGKLVADWDMWQSRSPAPPFRKVMALIADRWARETARLCVVASVYLQNEFRRQFGIEAAYVPFAAYLDPERADGESPYARPTAVYVGNLYDGVYDHDLVFHAAKLLKERGKTPDIAFLGEGPDLEKWRAWCKQNGLDNVHLLGFRRGDDLWRHIRHAAVTMFPIRPTLQNLCRCPSKHLAYAQARRPIIANRIGEVEQVLKDKAIWIDTTPEAFADAIDAAVSHPGPDVQYDLSNVNWSARTDELVAALKKSGLA